MRKDHINEEVMHRVIRQLNKNDIQLHLPVLAELLHQEWRAFTPWATPETITNRLQARILATNLNEVWCVWQNNHLVATASIIDKEIDFIDDAQWWIGEIYTHPTYRGQGIASALIQNVTDDYWKKTDQDLYLYTPDQQKLYQKMGWSITQNLIYQDEMVSIMKRTKHIDF
ncbi:GNAT family N-acetyltransferase [Providencia vermicola]|uniref:GNAT family N-acetyltransferase n=4 Tax=Providencia TaxID=586 RepID=A0ABD5L3Z4_PROST|nr:MULTISPECIES: GNAT family N-acetyltransferase [Providencia]ELR5046354.1 GNAT family N-acetyltransferase [Providencia rettgeri]ELR5119913.1 GNAT family N-acetyltransferase [Providencia stuartii]ELR5141670.1 GNAT family N-acetyltransferase [Providencia stuartii]ELR5291022.1 GNAT family N-acetyltransferase [Providencia stuartii]ELX8378168.1 GNAT family N-acetyltransferase [Providencia stuartii]